MINKLRIKEEFIHLIMLDGVSRQERVVADYLAGVLKALGAEVTFDGAGEKIGGDCGNLLARMPGNRPTIAPLMFNAHLDIISSRDGVEPVFTDGIFTSQQDKILGADDRSGIAAILEMLRVIKENNLPHGDLELVFTVAEEVGLLGAKHLDYGWIKALRGFSLDSGEQDLVIFAAPASNRMTYKVYGLAAHAGVHPEQGISAVQIASQAIVNMPLGRIDEETTANIGTIKGGTATNIIPDFVECLGEARSHDMAKLQIQTKAMGNAFRQALEAYRIPNDGNLPLLEEEIRLEYPQMRVAEDSPCSLLLRQGMKALGRVCRFAKTGGGSDANIFNSQGIETLIIGTGMHNPHTAQENIALADMVRCAQLLVELARV
ncbi:MAG: M20/M25/M40 family metallo-hydrolase [Candidatus Schekmanbacteria bacterium]|nr:M20/M25/M40 family metallo-hydrolase [Candidatus Schekmanbacteria bacterium]